VNRSFAQAVEEFLLKGAAVAPLENDATSGSECCFFCFVWGLVIISKDQKPIPERRQDVRTTIGRVAMTVCKGNA
jgi:hypothetical protein